MATISDLPGLSALTIPVVLGSVRPRRLSERPAHLIVERLKRIAASEKIKISDAALECIARMADGGMRDAQSILDQMIAFCGSAFSR